MKTFSNYAALAAVAPDQRLKALAAAVSFDIGLVNTFLDLNDGQVALGKAVALGPNVGAKAAMPTMDQIKGYLGTKYTTASDTPQLVDMAGRMASVFHTNMPEVDLGWSNLFTLHDLRGTAHDSFEIMDTNAGVTFTQQAPGETVKVRRNITENETVVKYVEFAAGVGILDAWLDFQKWWKVAEVVGEFTAKAWDKMAEWHYGLFTAQGAGIDVAFDTDDTKTLNNATGALFRATRDRGYAVGGNAGLWIITSPEQKGRVLKMLEATQGSLVVAYNQNAQPITANIAGVIATTYVAANDTGYYLVLPGRKNQRGNWKDLGVESQRDIYKGAQDIVGRMRFNAAVGDTAQVRRVKFA